MALRRAALGLAQRLGGASVELEAAFIGGNRAVLETLPGSTAQFECVRHASNQQVKMRIRAIKNIGKITKAMKMVAASKMRNAQVAMEKSRGMVYPFTRLFGDFPAADVGKVEVVAVSSDKGLCGGLNSNITKYTKTLLKLEGSGSEGGKQVDLVTIGDKGRAQLTRAEPAALKLTFQDTYKVRVTFPQASVLAEELLKSSPAAIKLLFNKFYSAISFKPTLATVLMPEALEKQLAEPSGNSRLDPYEVEATHERADTLRDLAEFQLAAMLYNALLENNCSEHASRMTAMENSTKSAGDMLNRLTLAYNRKRQATITTELIEIIAGASALMDK